MNAVGLTRLVSLLVAFGAIGCAVGGTASAQAEQSTPASGPAVTRITLREQSTARFGDSQTDVHVDVQPPPAAAAKLLWRHAADGRTLSTGESTVDEAGSAAFVLRVPPVKPGIVLGSRLTVALVDKDQKQLAEHASELWIFPRDPFALRTRWLKELKLSLYDPEGNTAKAFDELNVPFQKLSSLGTLEQTKSGIIVVGEGLNLARLSQLGPILLAAAAPGVPVLCLAPSAGQLPNPIAPGPSRVRAPYDAADAAAGEIIPLTVRFERERIVTELDKRLSAGAWNADAEALRRFLPAANRDELVLRVSADPSAWPWVEATYPQGNGLILCGYPIIKTWNDDPTARYLFARILEKLQLPKTLAAE